MPYSLLETQDCSLGELSTTHADLNLFAEVSS